MNFLEQILSECGADTLKAFTIVPGFGGYFKSVKGVSELSPTRITLALPKLTLFVAGENLSVGRYFEGDLFISGAISGVTIE